MIATIVFRQQIGKTHRKRHMAVRNLWHCPFQAYLRS
jgi:hypothetical protein